MYIAYLSSNLQSIEGSPSYDISVCRPIDELQTSRTFFFVVLGAQIPVEGDGHRAIARDWFMSSSSVKDQHGRSENCDEQRVWREVGEGTG